MTVAVLTALERQRLGTAPRRVAWWGRLREERVDAAVSTGRTGVLARGARRRRRDDGPPLGHRASGGGGEAPGPPARGRHGPPAPAPPEAGGGPPRAAPHPP